MGIDREKFKIEPDKDDGVSVVALSKHIEEDNQRKQNQFANEFSLMGDVYIKEIEQKKKRKQLAIKKLIPYILKHNDDIYEKEELLSYSFDDVKVIYDQTKKDNKSFLSKFVEFIFNIE